MLLDMELLAKLLLKFWINESNEMFRKFFYITTISQDVSFQIVQENN